MNDIVSPELQRFFDASQPLDHARALRLAEATGAEDLSALMAQAATLRDQGFRDVVTYSRKVFLPLTKLCRDVCHYCTFASTPREVGQAYLSVEEVLASAHEAAKWVARKPY